MIRDLWMFRSNLSGGGGFKIKCNILLNGARMLYLIYIWPGLHFPVVHKSILQVKVIVSSCHDVTSIKV